MTAIVGSFLPYSILVMAPAYCNGEVGAPYSSSSNQRKRRYFTPRQLWGRDVSAIGNVNGDRNENKNSVANGQHCCHSLPGSRESNFWWLAKKLDTSNLCNSGPCANVSTKRVISSKSGSVCNITILPSIQNLWSHHNARQMLRLACGRCFVTVASRRTRCASCLGASFRLTCLVNGHRLGFLFLATLDD